MSTAARRMWVSEEIFGWSSSFQSAHLTEPSRPHRPHDLLRHAEGLVTPSASMFALADAVLSLKRAVDSRLKHLEKLYRLSEAFSKSTGALERLTEVGLARPLLVKQLFDLRNDIEHNEVQPPEWPRCKELIDVVWYFLRATDDVCRVALSGTVLTQLHEPAKRDPALWVSIRVVEAAKDRLDIHGWLSFGQLSDIEREGFIPMETRVVHDKAESLGRSRALGLGPINGAFGRQDDERWIEADLLCTRSVLVQYWRRVFEAR